MIVVFLEIVNLTTTSRDTMHNHSCSYSLMGLPERGQRLYYQYYTPLLVVLDVESRANPNNAWDLYVHRCIILATSPGPFPALAWNIENLGMGLGTRLCMCVCMYLIDMVRLRSFSLLDGRGDPHIKSGRK